MRVRLHCHNCKTTNEVDWHGGEAVAEEAPDPTVCCGEVMDIGKQWMSSGDLRHRVLLQCGICSSRSEMGLSGEQFDELERRLRRQVEEKAKVDGEATEEIVDKFKDFIDRTSPSDFATS